MKWAGTRNMCFFTWPYHFIPFPNSAVHKWNQLKRTEKGNQSVNSDDQSTQIPALWTPSNQIEAKQQTVACTWSQRSEKYSWDELLGSGVLQEVYSRQKIFLFLLYKISQHSAWETSVHQELLPNTNTCHKISKLSVVKVTSTQLPKHVQWPEVKQSFESAFAGNAMVSESFPR